MGICVKRSDPALARARTTQAGVEMQYRNFSDKDMRGDPMHTFVIGPTMAWKPMSDSRFDLSALFGCPDASPRLQVLAVFSMFVGPGGGPERRGEAPACERK